MDPIKQAQQLLCLCKKPLDRVCIHEKCKGEDGIYSSKCQCINIINGQRRIDQNIKSHKCKDKNNCKKWISLNQFLKLYFQIVQSSQYSNSRSKNFKKIIDFQRIYQQKYFKYLNGETLYYTWKEMENVARNMPKNNEIKKIVFKKQQKPKRLLYQQIQDIKLHQLPMFNLENLSREIDQLTNKITNKQFSKKTQLFKNPQKQYQIKNNKIRSLKLDNHSKQYSQHPSTQSLKSNDTEQTIKVQKIIRDKKMVLKLPNNTQKKNQITGNNSLTIDNHLSSPKNLIDQPPQPMAKKKITFVGKTKVEEIKPEKQIKIQEIKPIKQESHKNNNQKIENNLQNPKINIKIMKKKEETKNCEKNQMERNQRFLYQQQGQQISDIIKKSQSSYQDQSLKNILESKAKQQDNISQVSYYQKPEQFSDTDNY